MFDKLKQGMLDKIERNCVKSNMAWTDSKGKVHTEEVIMKRSRLPIIGDWTRIYPPVNEDGTWNLLNLIFGGGRNLVKLIIIMGLLTMIYFGIVEIFSGYQELINNPCVQSCINPLTSNFLTP